MAAVCMTAVSCRFSNDLDYPVVEGSFLLFEAEGQKEVMIDSGERTIEITLGETADITALKVSYTLSEGASVDLPEILDLSSPVKVTVRTWQEYEWTISATQEIDRYVRCENQVGEAKFNLATKTVLVYVTESQPLSAVTINDMKLEPEGSVVKSTTGYVSNGITLDLVSQPCLFPMTLDCVLERTFFVLHGGETIQWNFKALQTESLAQIVSADAHCYHAGIRATFGGSGEPSIEYRKASESEWTKATQLSIAGVGISCDITGLAAGTDYLARICVGEYISGEYAFRTEDAAQLYNSSFDEWTKDGNGWYPWSGDGPHIWDSANKGTASLGVVPTTPESDDVVLGKAVRMESSTAFGQFAAGNIYIGSFSKVSGLGAELSWGTPFTSRPVALKGWYKYTPKTVDKAKDPHKDMLGKTDMCSIRIWLTDWSAPFTVNTSKNQFLEDDDKSIIALGELYSDETDSGYVPFEIPLNYRDDRHPTYIEIACSASRYGDYFTGGLGSVLLVDELELVYD